MKEERLTWGTRGFGTW